MKRVLILCTGNSCRSQMAEAIWALHGAGEWEAASAGSAPTGQVHPGAVAALSELGIAWEGRSKNVSEFAGQPIDLVITVCDHAREACPAFPGATETLHWPFPDPAEASGSDDEVRGVFRRVRDAIEGQILDYLADTGMIPPPAANRVAERLARVVDGWHGGLPDERATEYRRLIDGTRQLLETTLMPWDRLPALIAEIFGGRGWAWNGIYRRDRGQLMLTAAAGPPVCASLDLADTVGHGMCSDAVVLDQTIVAEDVTSYPGYVSCDGESGLGTRASLVSPIRGQRGTPLAVWDLDSTEPLAAEDGPFFDHYFSTLSAVLRPRNLGVPTGVRKSPDGKDLDGIRLQQFLKWQGVAETGGLAKVLIQNGGVKVNGDVETRRGRRLRHGDVVEVAGQAFPVGS